MILNKVINLRKHVSLNVFPEGFYSNNPSIANYDDGYVCLVQGCNFDREAIYDSCEWQAMDSRDQFTVKYKIVTLDYEFNITSSLDLDTTIVGNDPPCYNQVQDLRLFWFRDRLMVMGTYAKINFVWTGIRWVMPEDQLWRVFTAEIESNKLINLNIIDSPTGARREKNWIPCVHSAGNLLLIANINTGAKVRVQFDQGDTETLLTGKREAFAWKNGWSGSSCLIPYDDNYVAILHRRSTLPPYLYKHMFVLLDNSLAVRKRSNVFTFDGFPIEFCCGLLIDGEKEIAVISYGQFDKSAAIIEMNLSDVTDLINVDLDHDNPLDLVSFDHVVSAGAVRRVMARHEEFIWRLFQELANLQAKINTLSAQNGEVLRTLERMGSSGGPQVISRYMPRILAARYKVEVVLSSLARFIYMRGLPSKYTVSQTVACRVIARYEKIIWRLLGYLAVGQNRIDTLTVQNGALGPNAICALQSTTVP